MSEYSAHKNVKGAP